MKVLIAEDDGFLVKNYLAFLDEEGFSVSVAKNGEEAVKMAREEKPNIILLDILMPVKDGFVALEELKTDPDLQDIPVVVLSNLSDDNDKRKAIEMGAVGYCVKSDIDPEYIVTLIKKFHD